MSRSNVGQAKPGMYFQGYGVDHPQYTIAVLPKDPLGDIKTLRHNWVLQLRANLSPLNRPLKG